VLPDAASVVNPVDVAGGTDDDQRVFYDCAEAIVADPNVDALLLAGLFGGYGIRFAEQYTDVECGVAEELVTLAERHDTPIVVQSAYAEFDTEPHEILRESGIPVVESIDVAASSLESLAAYGEHLATADEKSDFRFDGADNDAAEIRHAIEAGRRQLSEYTAKRALRERGLPVVPFELAESPSEALDAARTTDSPVAMKVVSPDIVHKSDAGGVALGVDDDDVEATYEDLLAAAESYAPDADIEGVLVSPMREGSVELIVGVVDDEQFGRVMMVGLGGVFVEVLEDVAFRALPLSEADAHDMLDDIEAQELLDGARGNPPVDRDAVVDFLLEVSAFVEANPAVEELDLNPVFADDDGVEIVDAAVTLRAPGTDTETAPAPVGESDD